MIVTISREFGSGGRELGKRLADLLKFDYYDSEIISAVAEKTGMEKGYIEQVLSNHGWKTFPISIRGTISSAGYMQNNNISILLKQKEVIEEIAALNKNCVIVGRNADIILKDYRPLNIFVCASTESKVKRCIERASESEKLTEKEIIHKIKQIDKARSQTRELMSGSAWGQPKAYHLTINTTDWEINNLVPAVAEFVMSYFGRKQ